MICNFIQLEITQVEICGGAGNGCQEGSVVPRTRNDCAGEAVRCLWVINVPSFRSSRLCCSASDCSPGAVQCEADKAISLAQSQRCRSQLIKAGGRGLNTVNPLSACCVIFRAVGMITAVFCLTGGMRQTSHESERRDTAALICELELCKLWID